MKSGLLHRTDFQNARLCYYDRGPVSSSLVALSGFAFAYIDIPAGYRRRAAEGEIGLIETGDLLQLLGIDQGEPTVRQCNEVVPAHPLQDAVDVPGCQPECVGELDLRQRQPDRMILGQANGLLPPHQLAHPMGDACRRVPASERDDALAVDRLLLQRIPP